MNHQSDCTCDRCLLALLTAPAAVQRQQGWQAWYDRDRSAVYGYIVRRCRNLGCVEHSDDILQDTFLIAFKNLNSGRFEQQGKALCAYLYGIARNLIYDMARLQQREVLHESETDLPNPHAMALDEQLYLQEVLSNVGDACTQLTPIQRNVVDGLYGQGKSSQDVGVELAKSAMNVRAIAVRATSVMRTYLARRYQLQLSADAIKLCLKTR